MRTVAETRGARHCEGMFQDALNRSTVYFLPGRDIALRCPGKTRDGRRSATSLPSPLEFTDRVEGEAFQERQRAAALQDASRGPVAEQSALVPPRREGAAGLCRFSPGRLLPWANFTRAFLAAVILLLTGIHSDAGPKDESQIPTTNKWPIYVLESEATWQLNPPQGERFDASGLAFDKDGSLLTVNDRGAGAYRIVLKTKKDSADLVRIPDCFTDIQLAPFAAEKVGRYDCEGITLDERGRILICEEANRWILRWDPATKKVDRFPIDWSPLQRYFSEDRNSSFEGIAFTPEALFVANERHHGRIIAVDLKTRKVTDDFTVHPSTNHKGDVHYSDLSWFDGFLYALLRENRVLVKIDPHSHAIVAEYNFYKMEQQPSVAYLTEYPTSTFEGVAVDKDYFWFVTDNNGLPRRKFPKDTRPTLFKCRRPDIKSQSRAE